MSYSTVAGVEGLQIRRFALRLNLTHLPGFFHLALKLGGYYNVIYFTSPVSMSIIAKVSRYVILVFAKF